MPTPQLAAHFACVPFSAGQIYRYTLFITVWLFFPHWEQLSAAAGSQVDESSEGARTMKGSFKDIKTPYKYYSAHRVVQMLHSNAVDSG